MPNYVYNTVKFDVADVEKVKKLVAHDDYEFDFNRIIPMPEELNIVSGSSTYDAEKLLKDEGVIRVLKNYVKDIPDPSMFYKEIDEDSPFQQHRTPKTIAELIAFADLIKSNREKYGCTDWYSWRNQNWNTKWNACDATWNGCDVHFDTAWSEPAPIFLKLSEMLGIRFDVTCEEESLAFCIVATYDNGEIVYEEDAEGIEGLKLLGSDKADAIDRYASWLDEGSEEYEEIMQQINAVYSEE